MELQVWFEFASTYSYPALMRVEQLASAHGVHLSWQPFLLGPIFKAQGWSDSPFNIYPAKGRYMWRDLERICADLQLPLRRPSVFPRNGLLPARICASAMGEPWLPAFVRAVYRANFELDQDISSPAVVAECLMKAGQDPAAVLALGETQEAKDALRRQTETAIHRGVFGAPAFIYQEELFWGNDRLETAIEWARHHAAA